MSFEDKNIEFKENFSVNVLKTLCAFANTDGGKVLLGVKDDGTIKGISIDNQKIREITEKIVSKLGIYPDIQIKEIEGKKLLEISMRKSNVPISFEGKYYERVGNTTREMGPERLREFLLKTKSWDTLTIEDASFDDIEVESVRRFLKIANVKGRLNIFDENSDIKTVFEHLKLWVNGKLTNGAIILFGKNPQKYFLNAVLRIVRLKNEATIIGDRLISGNLFRQVIEGEEVLKSFLNVRYEIKGIEREEVWDYPLPAIREALMNALIHRDYFKWNVQTQIKIFDNFIWFYNIGKLPEGITIEQLKKPHPSIPRNPVIVHIFYLAGFIEEVGSGIGRILNEMRKANLPEPDFIEEMGGFSVYFRKDIYSEEYLKNLGLKERQIRAVLYVKEKGKITNREYRNLAKLSDESARKDLNILVQKGILTIKGEGRSVYYVLKNLRN